MKTADIAKEASPNPTWNWKTQLDNWNGNCLARQVLQSPINIFAGITVSDPKILSPFNFVIDFGTSEFIVVKRYTEIFAQFTQQAGSFNIIYRDVTIQFQPVGLYFRFPGEHTINGVRNKGEMIIRLNQIQPDQVSIHSLIHN